MELVSLVNFYHRVSLSVDGIARLKLLYLESRKESRKDQCNFIKAEENTQSEVKGTIDVEKDTETDRKRSDMPYLSASIFLFVSVASLRISAFYIF